MKKLLGLRGDESKGDEVMGILKSMGGIDTDNWSGTDPDRIYYINPVTGDIESKSLCVFTDDEIKNISRYVRMEVDDFYKKYPFKCGDKINHKDLGNGTIIELLWDGFLECVKYKISITDVNEIQECDVNDLTSVIEDEKVKSVWEEVFDYIESTYTTINLNSDITRVVIPDSHEVLIRDKEVIFIKKGILPTV